MSMTASIDSAQIARMKAAIEGTSRRLRKELAIACNKTASRCKNIVAKNIGQELDIPQKAIKLSIKVGRKANEVNISSHVDVKKDGRINIGYFKAYQTKKGVSYRIGKGSGRKLAQGAFVIKKYNGKAYQRKGKERFPLRGLYGPSPWGVHTKGGKSLVSLKETEEELKKQVDKRIQFLTHKKSKAI